VCALEKEFHWAEDRLLGGLKIAVTRPKDRNSSLADKLSMLGAEIVIMPTIETKEIEDMNKLIKELKENPQIDETKEAEYLKEYKELVNNPMAHSSHQTSNPKSVDEAFAQGMIMHHQMAVDMSKIILKYTDNEKITKLAQDIIEAQEKEIKFMEEILENLKDKKS